MAAILIAAGASALILAIVGLALGRESRWT
jgi:hypothetical protein